MNLNSLEGGLLCQESRSKEGETVCEREAVTHDSGSETARVSERERTTKNSERGRKKDAQRACQRMLKEAKQKK